MQTYSVRGSNWKLSADDRGELGRWLTANAVIGSFFAAAVLAMAVAGIGAPDSNAARPTAGTYGPSSAASQHLIVSEGTGHGTR